jgi:hypothetical protein
VSIEDRRIPAAHIEIPGNTLVPDAEFCRVALNNATRRTAARYEAYGLPFVMVAGRKYRPLNEGRAWLAARIERRNPHRRRRA